MIYLLLKNAVMGPYAQESVAEMWRQGAVSGATPFCRLGTTEWQTLSNISRELGVSDGPSLPSRINLMSALAALVLFCFPWIGIQCHGVNVVSQSGLQAAYGGISLQTPMEAQRLESQKADDLPMSVLTGAALVAVVGASVTSFRFLRDKSAYGHGAARRLCALACLLLLVQGFKGFPLVNKVNELQGPQREPGPAGFPAILNMNPRIIYEPALFAEFAVLAVPGLFVLYLRFSKKKA